MKTMLTDIFGRQAYVAQSAEAGCLGAAILAGTAAGVFTDEEAASKNFVKLCEHYTPDTTKFDTYSKAYRLYREAYKSLKNFFKMS